MSDAVSSRTLFDEGDRVVMEFTNASDGTGEAAVKKVDVSALNARPNGKTPTRVKIDWAWWSCAGMSARLFWDATGDVEIIILADSGYMDFGKLFGGFKNDAGSGITGDIMLTTHGHAAGDSYTVILGMRKVA
jgi:hypothetical protein